MQEFAASTLHFLSFMNLSTCPLKTRYCITQNHSISHWYQYLTPVRSLCWPLPCTQVICVLFSLSSPLAFFMQSCFRLCMCEREYTSMAKGQYKIIAFHLWILSRQTVSWFSHRKTTNKEIGNSSFPRFPTQGNTPKQFLEIQVPQKSYKGCWVSFY